QEARAPGGGPDGRRPGPRESGRVRPGQGILPPAQRKASQQCPRQERRAAAEAPGRPGQRQGPAGLEDRIPGQDPAARARRRPAGPPAPGPPRPCGPPTMDPTTDIVTAPDTPGADRAVELVARCRLDDQRLDQYLAAAFPDHSRSVVRRVIDAGGVT